MAVICYSRISGVGQYENLLDLVIIILILRLVSRTIAIVYTCTCNYFFLGLLLKKAIFYQCDEAKKA